MTDDQTLTLEEAFAKATSPADDSSLKTDEPSEEAEPKVEEAEESIEDKPEATETDEDADLEKFDPEKLPPELKPLYKNLMKGFTQGRQKDSEKAKAAEEKLAKLEAQLDSMRKGESESPESPKFNTPEEYVDYLVEKKNQEKEISNYRDSALVDYESSDERLRRPSEDKENPAYDRYMDSAISGELDALLSEHVATHGNELGFDHKAETKRLIEEWDSYFKGQIKSYIDKQNQLVKTKTGELRAHNPKTSPGKAEPAKKMSLSEAMEAAHEKLQSK